MFNIQNFKKGQNGISRCSEWAYLVDSGRCHKQALLIFVDGAGAENLGCQCQLVFCEQKNTQYCFVCSVLYLLISQVNSGKPHVAVAWSRLLLGRTTFEWKKTFYRLFFILWKTRSSEGRENTEKIIQFFIDAVKLYGWRLRISKKEMRLKKQCNFGILIVCELWSHFSNVNIRICDRLN